MATTNHHSQVRNAIEAGNLPKLDGSILCVDCGEPATEYDHRDETDQLNVDPVCHKCNLKRGPAVIKANRRMIRINLTARQHQEFRACAALTGRTITAILTEAALGFITENRSLLTKVNKST